MFFQETTPDTSGYMIAGYVIAFLVMALYVASIYLRTRNLNRDMTMFSEMDQPAETIQSSTATPKQSPAGPRSNGSAESVTKKSREK